MDKVTGWESVWSAYVDALSTYHNAKGRRARQGSRLHAFKVWYRLVAWCDANGEAWPRGCSPD